MTDVPYSVEETYLTPDQTLRIIALENAVSQQSYNGTPDETTYRALRYYNFLKGESNG